MNRALKLAAGAALAIAMTACSRGGGPTAPIDLEDWSYPEDATAFAITAWSPDDSIATAEIFEVRVVAYNLPAMARAAVYLEYRRNDVEFVGATAGPYFPNITVLASTDISVDLGRVHFEGRQPSSTGVAEGSGVIFKARFRALRSARTRLRFEPPPELVAPGGGDIPDRDALQVIELEFDID